MRSDIQGWTGRHGRPVHKWVGLRNDVAGSSGSGENPDSGRPNHKWIGLRDDVTTLSGPVEWDCIGSIGFGYGGDFDAVLADLLPRRLDDEPAFAVARGESADVVEAAIRSHLHAMRGLVHCVAVMPDHVHIAVSFPPSVLLSDAVGQTKGRSSNLVRLRHPHLAEAGFSWQGNYGVLSFSETGLDQVKAYIANQEAHHRDNTLDDRLELTSGPNMTVGKPAIRKATR